MSGRGSRFMGMVLALGLSAMALVFVFAVAEPYMHREVPREVDGMAIFVLALGTAIFGSLLFGPVGKAIKGMLEAGPRDDLATMRLEELEARLSNMETRGLSSGEVEAQFSRLAEVEDRLDFAERLLARVDPTLQERLP
ncbi:MAG: hypothetical protein V4558_01315 [Gemmatimonadota bacterium]